MKINTDTLQILLETQHEREVLKMACIEYRAALNAESPQPLADIGMMSDIIDKLNASPEDFD